MQDNEWQEFDFSEFEDQQEFVKKNAKKQNKRKWREIEAYKEQLRVKKEIGFCELY